MKSVGAPRQMVRVYALGEWLSVMLEYAAQHWDASIILCPSLLHALCQLAYNATARAKVGKYSLSKMGNTMGSDTQDDTNAQAPHTRALPTRAAGAPTPVGMSDALATAFAEVARPWRVARELSSAALDAITRAAPITNLQAQLLDNRGIHGAAAAQRFLTGDWRAQGVALPNQALAVARLRRAAREGERIIVFGDYDSDGMTSCAILLVALRALGAQADPYIPRRDDDGRGLNLEAVDLLASQGARLIVTTDCGSANVAEVARAHELGMEVIITDHHPPYGELPDCLIVNPQLGHADAASHSQASAPTQPTLSTQADGHDPIDRGNLADISGAGVAFHLAQALLTAPPNEAEETDADAVASQPPSLAPRAPTLTDAEATATLTSLLDLVVIGTIGDVVPLTPHNWALAHAGLKRLGAQPRIGLRALLASAGIAPGQATERDIAFAIAPRLNAAARLGQPMTALHLLICDDDVEASQLAAQLESLNQERQRITDQVMAEAREQARTQVRAQHGERPSLVFVIGDGWPLGIIGLVAGRLVDEYSCAAVTLSRMGDECRASARGPEGVNLVAALAERPDFFRRFGGHARAAGFTIATADVEALREYLTQRLATLNTAADDVTTASGAGGAGDAGDASEGDAAPAANAERTTRGAAPEPLAVDCRLPLDRVTLPKYAEARRLAPYGVGFPEPQFVCKGARIVRCWPSGVERRNLRLAIRDASAERVFLWSRQGALCDDLRAAIPRLPAYDVVYTFDAYQRPDGESQLTARIVALRPVTGA